MIDGASYRTVIAPDVELALVQARPEPSAPRPPATVVLDAVCGARPVHLVGHDWGLCRRGPSPPIRACATGWRR